MKQDLRLLTARGNALRVTRYGQGTFGQKPCVLYVHGFKGFKDWGFVPHLAGRLVAEGMDVVTFNFSHNGIGPDGETHSEPDLFAKNTLSLEREETIEMIRVCLSGELFGGQMTRPLGLLGHSRGGGMALLAAAEVKQVRAVCTWNAVSTFERYSEQVVEAWKKKGYTEVVNARTGQVLRMGIEHLRDLEAHAPQRLNILEATRKLERPLLILHGQTDETVPYFEAEQLNVFGSPASTELRLIPKGSHTFGATHPFQQEEAPLSLAIGHTISFFQQFLFD